MEFDRNFSLIFGKQAIFDNEKMATQGVLEIIDMDKQCNIVLIKPENYSTELFEQVTFLLFKVMALVGNED